MIKKRTDLDNIFRNGINDKNKKFFNALKFDLVEAQYFIDFYKENFDNTITRQFLHDTLAQFKTDHPNKYVKLNNMIQKLFLLSIIERNYIEKSFILLLDINIFDRNQFLTNCLGLMFDKFNSKKLKIAIDDIIQAIDDYSLEKCFNEKEQEMLSDIVIKKIETHREKITEDPQFEDLLFSSLRLFERMSTIQYPEPIISINKNLLNTLCLPSRIKKKAIDCFINFFKATSNESIINYFHDICIGYYNIFKSNEAREIVKKLYFAIEIIGTNEDGSIVDEYALNKLDEIKKYFNNFEYNEKNRIDSTIFEGG